MTNHSSTAIAEGFNVLLNTAGETLTFRNYPLVALVNRNYVVPINLPEYYNRQLRQTQIEFRLTDISPAPKEGEEFVDSYGKYHRISQVKETTYSYICECIVSE